MKAKVYLRVARGESLSRLRAMSRVDLDTYLAEQELKR